MFRLSFVRQLATDADGGLTQVECSLDYALSTSLGDLGAFHQWWFPTPGLALDEWFAALAGRPEWALLNQLTPLGFGFETDRVC